MKPQRTRGEYRVVMKKWFVLICITKEWVVLTGMLAWPNSLADTSVSSGRQPGNDLPCLNIAM